MLAVRKNARLVALLLGTATLACGFLLWAPGGASFFKHLHGRRDYLTVQAYNNLLQEIENISRAVLSVENQAETLGRDIEELKSSARSMLGHAPERTVQSSAVAAPRWRNSTGNSD